MITITQKAAEKCLEIMEAEDLQGHGLRLRVIGGGCAGYSYDLYPEDKMTQIDMTLEDKGIKLYIDPLSYQYLQGIQIDFVEGLHGSGFKFSNPVAPKSTSVARKVKCVKLGREGEGLETPPTQGRSREAGFRERIQGGVEDVARSLNDAHQRVPARSHVRSRTADLADRTREVPLGPRVIATGASPPVSRAFAGHASEHAEEPNALTGGYLNSV